jgi:hypothetical protein
MADNVAITPGSGATIAADDISSVLYQRVKISVGADGSATDVSSAAPLPTVGAWTTLTAAPAVTAGAYSANDAVGALMTFTNAVRASGGRAKIHTINFTDLGVTANVLNLWLFSDSIAAIADNAAWDPSDAELLTCVGVIQIAAADYLVATDNQAATKVNVGFVYNCTGTSLYGQFECVGTPTYASTSDIKIRMQVEYLD